MKSNNTIAKKNKYLSSPYRWVIEGILSGLWMFLFMEIFFRWAMHETFTSKRVLIGFAYWVVAGLVYGLLTKYWRIYLEKRAAKKNLPNE